MAMSEVKQAKTNLIVADAMSGVIRDFNAILAVVKTTINTAGLTDVELNTITATVRRNIDKAAMEVRKEAKQTLDKERDELSDRIQAYMNNQPSGVRLYAEDIANFVLDMPDEDEEPDC